MDTGEIKSELLMSYSEQVDYLLKKYGSAKYDYFCTKSCKSRNSKISRTGEGLACHHIDEDKAIMLSTPSYAVRNPFEYQKADRLVYCNLLEHLLLHIKIILEPRHPDSNPFERPGVGGIVVICRNLNDYFGGREIKREYQKKMYEPVSRNINDYIGILIFLIIMVKKYRPDCLLKLNKENLSCDSGGKIVDKIYKKLPSS